MINKFNGKFYHSSTILLLILFFGCHMAFSQSVNEFKAGVMSRGGDTIKYRYLLPPDFDSSKKYPLVLFLHGAGERGNDNKKQLAHGSRLFKDSINKYPAVVIFPQCPKDSYWSSVNIISNEEGKRTFLFTEHANPTKAMKLLLHLVDSVAEQDHIDKNRMYVGGLSMGGMGTFEVVSRRPDLFAAAVPICGGGNPEMVKKYNPTTAFWVFHGKKDDIVPPVHSTVMVQALQQKDFDVRYTLYHYANHNSWDRAFSESELLSWLFSQNFNNK